jgi:hypothetical protein
MEHFLLQLWLAQIHRAVNFEFIFEDMEHFYFNCCWFELITMLDSNGSGKTLKG